MQLEESFTVLEDCEPIGIFYTYEQAVDHMRKHAVRGCKYQIVKAFVTAEESRPTIADTGWKDEYKGMWADVDGYINPQLILDVVTSNDILISDGILVSDFTSPRVLHVDPEDVRPRYDLAPVNLTPHPAYLETLEDYQNAPEYTIVASKWDETCPALVKDACGEWADVGGGDDVESTNLAGSRRKVLYWTNREEENDRF